MGRRGGYSFPLSGDRRRILAWMCLLIAVNQLGFGGIVPVTALYAESFGVGATAVGLTVAIYGLARFLVNVPAGRLADRRGRRPTLALGGLVTVLGNALCALAPDFATFVAARFVAGCGAAMVLTGGQVVLADIASPENRGRVMAVYQGVFLFAVGLGPLPGGLLAERAGLAAPFWANALLAGVVALLAWFRVPETRPPRPAAVPGPARGGRSPAALAELRELAAVPGFLLVSLVSFAAFFARTGALFSIVPLLAEEEMGLTAGQIGLGLGLVSVVGLLLVYPSGVLVDRFGRKGVIVPATVLTGGAMLLFAVASDLRWYLVACACWSAASGVGGAAPAAYAADTAPPGRTATALGAYRSIADSGYVAGPLILGAVADVASPEAALVLVAGLLVACGATFARFAPETLPSARRPAVASETRAPG